VIGFLDCYSGIGGDMLLGALVDAGLPMEHLRTTIAALGLANEVEVSAEIVMRAGLRATKVTVAARDDVPHRTFMAVKSIVDGSTLSPAIKAASLSVLGRIARVEGEIHGRPADEVELHEVGSLDSIVDVVAAVAGLVEMGIDRLAASALPVSTGELRGAAHHAALPSPAPATLALLASVNAPVRPFGDGRELVTPTGAALVAELAAFEQPEMRLRRVGYGAGAADTTWPNVLRLWVGEPLSAVPGAAEPARHVVLETNIDDMNPQLLAPAVEAILASGVLDVTVTPLQMKKGRTGSLVTVVANAADEERLAQMLLRETTTLGVRVHDVRRHEADRRFAQVETPYGTVTVKLKVLDGAVIGATPEFESVRAVAQAAGALLSAVHASAAAATLALVGDDGSPKDLPSAPQHELS
jgi:hypothetical protein